MSLTYFVKYVVTTPTLYVADGNSSDTHAVQAFAASTSIYLDLGASGQVYFEGDDGTHGYELWTSDGSAVGTYMLEDINAGSGSSYPYDVVNVNGTVYFGAYYTGTAYGLYKSNGTQAGTDICKIVYGGLALRLHGSEQQLDLPRLQLGGRL